MTNDITINALVLELWMGWDGSDNWSDLTWLIFSGQAKNWLEAD